MLQNIDTSCCQNNCRRKQSQPHWHDKSRATVHQQIMSNHISTWSPWQENKNHNSCSTTRKTTKVMVQDEQDDMVSSHEAMDMDMDEAMAISKEFVTPKNMKHYLTMLCLIIVKKSRKLHWSEVPQVHHHQTCMGSGGHTVCGVR